MKTPLLTRDYGRTPRGRNRRKLAQILWGAWWEPVNAQAPWQAKEERFRARIRAAMRRSPDGTILDGIAAAHWWGLPIMGKCDLIEVITNVNHSRHTSHWGRGEDKVTIKPSSRTIPEDAVVEQHGIRVLKVEYLCAELLARHAPEVAIPIVEAALNRVLSPSPLNRTASEDAFSRAKETLQVILETRRWKRGVRKALNLLKRLSPWSESVGESKLRLLMQDLGLPEPKQQWLVTTEDGVIWPDFAWPAHGIAVEFDGLDKYKENTARILQAEKQREEKLRRVYPTIVRFIWKDFFNGRARQQLLKLSVRLRQPPSQSVPVVLRAPS